MALGTELWALTESKRPRGAEMLLAMPKASLASAELQQSKSRIALGL